MSDLNRICFRCKQPLIEMNSYGQLVWGSDVISAAEVGDPTGAASLAAAISYAERPGLVTLAGFLVLEPPEHREHRALVLCLNIGDHSRSYRPSPPNRLGPAPCHHLEGCGLVVGKINQT